jgi:hypothetical protein
MWLNRLPPDYRRRYYTNLAIFAALVIFFVVVGKLPPRAGTDAVLGLFGLLVGFMCVWPFVQLARADPRPPRSAYVLCGAWVAAYALAIAGFFVPPLLLFTLPALLVGLVLMFASMIVYRRILLPSLFNGQYRERFAAAMAARRADREELNDVIASIHRKDDA